MRVKLIAQSQIQQPFHLEDDVIGKLGMLYQDCESAAERIAEFAGRTCYQSYERPNPATAPIDAYLANIIAQGHESVFEHAHFTFYVDGVSRNLLLELERHRHLSFSVISQRFVNSEDTPLVLHPTLRDSLEEEQSWEDSWVSVLRGARELYAEIVSALEKRGATRKQAREAARSVLPGGLETKFVVSGNARAWRDVLKKRYSVHADAEIRELATELLRVLRCYAEGLFQDFPEEPYA